MTALQVGDRVELVAMADDPDPLPQGSQGTVTWINVIRGRSLSWQIAVAWDNGRSLMAVTPPDLLRRLADG